MMPLLRWLAIVVLALFASVAQAQLSDVQRAYYEQWLAAAERAERAIDADRASTATFEELRSELVTFRQNFVGASDRNSQRLETLQAQLQALGPAPEEGLTEPPDIAALRSNLTAQIRTVQVPIIVSDEAHSRANGLISEIDQIIRQRQARALFTRVASPLSPSLWPEALEVLRDTAAALVNETRQGWISARNLQTIRNNLAVILFSFALALLLVFRGGVWSEQAGERLRQFGGQGKGVWRPLVSLGRVALPLLGIRMLVVAIDQTGVLGLRGGIILHEVPTWAAYFLGARWLAEQLYSKRDEDALIPLPAAARGLARTNLAAVALLFILDGALTTLAAIEPLSDETRGVLGFPIVGAAALVLLQVRQNVFRPDYDPADGEAARIRLIRVRPYLRVLSIFAGISAPILAAVGYGHLAEAILLPTLATLAVFGLIVVVQNFLAAIYAVITQKSDVSESIFPVLASFVLVFAALPVLALIWGARVSDLTELWSRFLEGFNIGGTVISPVDFLTFAIVFAAGYAATRALQGALANSLLPRTRLDPGGQNAIVSGTGYVGVVLAALIAISTAGIDLSSLAIVAGALSVGIGFGLQNIVSNFVSGIILLVERPISEGDWIEVNGQMGYVRNISVRSTRIETFDRTDVIVPNGDLVSGLVTNYTRGNTVGRVIVAVGVAYGTDTRKVEEILRGVAEDHPMVLANPAPAVIFQGFGADALDFEIRAILRDVNWSLSVKSEMNHEIAKRFAAANIEIPFAQRDIWIRNPEVLPAAQQVVDSGDGDDPEPGPRTT